MGRIHTCDDGSTIHIGGRLQPSQPHAIMLHDPKFGLNLGSWPTSSASHWSDAPAAQPVLEDELGNDEHGDCTEADQFHRQAMRQAAAGVTVYRPTVGEVLGIYSRDSGFVNGQPATDVGCDETTVLRNAQQYGIPCGPAGAANKIVGWAGLDATNRQLVRACIDAFGPLPVCVCLPGSWIAAMQNGPGFVLDVPKDGFNPSDGHCMTLGDQSDASLTDWSWGRRGSMTYDGLAAAAVSANGGMLYVALDDDMIVAATRKAPDALDWAALRMAFASLPGGVMTPAAP